jgi:surface protein
MNISASDIPNLTNVSDMSSMFEGCSTMTGPYNINEWNTSMVTNMSSLFKGATQFNQDIGSWNTSNVTDMSFMFMLANTFNQNIENWDVSNVTNMYEMFCMMDSFNQPLNGWDVSSVYDMSYMFAECHAFNQNIGNWTLKNNVQLLSFFNNCGLDCDNYSNTLIGWSINNPTVQNRTLYANQLEYGIDGQAARTFLIFNRGWLILGDYLSQTDCSNQQLSINSDNALLNIYPNPVTDILTIQLEKPSEIKIFSSAGTLIYDGFENAVLSFDMSPLSTGIYFIHINNKVYKISKI